MGAKSAIQIKPAFCCISCMKTVLCQTLLIFQPNQTIMRKIFFILLLTYFIISCNNPAEKSTAKMDVADTTKPVYAYTIKQPDNWDIGSSKNTAIALSALKAFENNKIDESLGYFADSAELKLDYMEGKYSKDSLKSIFNAVWKETTAMKIDMHDFESVISKDKKDEYVTLWYVQTNTDKKGKVDSVAVINDFKISNGKIVTLEEAIRHFKMKK